ncbi:hypothetical protein L6R52_34745 [Myxococcota bacterium]|nr:hypothetical protein [Myxococcota bacterium]
MRRWGTCALFALAAIGCDPSRPVRVRADASVDGCPSLFGPSETVWLETTCLPERCAAVATQEGCALELSVSACESGSLSGVIDASGAVTFAGSGLFGECSVIGDGRALLSAACVSELRSCRIDVHRPGPSLDASLTRVQIFDVPFEGPPGSTVQLLDQLDPLRGYLTDAVMLDDRIAVAAHDRRARSLDCNAPEPSRLTFVDVARAAVTSSTSAPPCLTRLARDPLGPGLLGVFGSEPLELGRFDASGALVDSAPLDLPAEVRHFAVALLPGPMETVIIAVSRGFPATSFVLFADTASLALRRTSPPIEGRIRHAIADAAGDLVASEIYEQQVLRIDGATGVIEDVVRLSTSRRVSGDAGFVVALPDRAALAVAATGAKSALWALDVAEGSTTPIAGTAVFFEVVAAPWAMVPSPAEPELVVGASTSTAPGYEARLAHLDLDGPRWLPGSLVVGRGVVSALMVRDRVLWAVLPWSAELVRIEFH